MSFTRERSTHACGGKRSGPPSGSRANCLMPVLATPDSPEPPPPSAHLPSSGGSPPLEQGNGLWDERARPPMRFLLDEDLNPAAAEIGRGLGCGLDVVSVHEIDRRGFSDEK